MLVAFDFDGTLSDDEMIVLLGEQAGCRDEIADVTARAMRGELGYAESLRARVDLLAGLDEDAVRTAFSGVALRPGAATLIEALRDAGVTVAILTGAFEDGVAAALDREGVTVDEIVANRLHREAGGLAGTVEGPLVEGTKNEALRSLAGDRGVALADTIAVGDGANDVPMLDVAGTAIGFQPKPAVRSHCDVIVETMGALREQLEVDGVLPAR